MEGLGASLPQSMGLLLKAASGGMMLLCRLVEVLGEIEA
jgi:hypothetical protein